MSVHIGISAGREGESGRIQLPSNYASAVRRAGGIPWVLPVFSPGEVDGELTAHYLDRLDGLLLSGGVDLDPAHFGGQPHRGLGQVSPERDEIELSLAWAALERDMPLLAICRGIQVLNAAAGGTLIQDVSSQVEESIQHQQRAPRWHASHRVVVEEDSRVARVLELREPSLAVNSFHHQAVEEVAPGFTVCARASDGVVEAIEGREHFFAVGVQWHPEMMYERHPVMLGLFRGLVDAACSFRKKVIE
ncbi:MAG: gamma-glutamyl-gamma-aminobutyrate hydrolase family protein [Bacillota bacterium]